MDSRFTPAVIAAAQAGQAAYDVPAAVTLAQWALESAYGTHMPLGSNNPFGIKANEGEPHTEAMTWEVIRGQRQEMVQRFRKFSSLAEAFEAHARLLATSHYYVKAMASKTPDEFARALTGVYATDPSYGSKLIAIMRANNLYTLDEAPAAKPAPVSPASASPTSGPSSAPASVPPVTAEGSKMNPVSTMLWGAKLFMGALPTLMSTAATIEKNMPDIKAKAQALVAGLEKAFDDAKHLDINSTEADLGAAWKAGMAVYDDVGLPRTLVNNTIGAMKDIPALGSLNNAVSIAKQIGDALGKL